MTCTSEQIDWNDILSKLQQGNPFTPEQVDSQRLKNFDMANDYSIPRKLRRKFKR